MARGQRLVTRRATSHFTTVDDALKAAGINNISMTADTLKNLSVNTQYFAVRGRLRLGNSTVQEVSLVERNGTSTKVLWRQRETPAAVPATTATASLQ
jgi:general secretion pathway protein K